MNENTSTEKGRYIKVYSRTPINVNSKLNGEIQFDFNTSSNEVIICRRSFVEIECSIYKNKVVNTPIPIANSTVDTTAEGPDGFFDATALVVFLSDTSLYPLFTNTHHTMNNLQISQMPNYDHVNKMLSYVESNYEKNDIMDFIDTYSTSVVSGALGIVHTSGSIAPRSMFSTLNTPCGTYTDLTMNPAEMSILSNTVCQSGTTIQPVKYYQRLRNGLFNSPDGIIIENTTNKMSFFVNNDYLQKLLCGGVCNNTSGRITTSFNISAIDTAVASTVVFKVHNISLMLYYEESFTPITRNPQQNFNQYYSNIIELRQSTDESFSLSIPVGTHKIYISLIDNRTDQRVIPYLYGKLTPEYFFPQPDPNGFVHANMNVLTELSITYRNVTYPYMPYVLNFSTAGPHLDNLRAYKEFLDNSNCTPDKISYKMWRNNPVFCWQFPQSNNDMSNGLFLRFKSSEPFRNVSVLLVAEYMKTLEFDIQNNIIKEIEVKTNLEV